METMLAYPSRGLEPRSGLCLRQKDAMTRSNYKLRRLPLAVAVLLFGLGQPALAEEGIRTQRVQFAKGANSAVVEGTIKGSQTVDYVLHAAQGQYMNVSMATDNTASYFNILAPGET